MKDSWHRMLGYLGLVEDDYNEHGPTSLRGGNQATPDEDWARGPARPATPFPANPLSAQRPVSHGVSFDAPAPSAPRIPDPQRPLRSQAAPTMNNLSSFSAQRDIVAVRPSNVSDCRKIADYLRENRAVLVMLESESELAKQVKLFASGVGYALGAKMEKINDARLLLTPSAMVVPSEVRQKLATVTIPEV
jgi:FtsZ-interacting cell division protein YlmF